MPVVAPILSNAIQAQFLLKKLTGRDAINIAGSVGSAVARYLTLPNIVTCTLNGTAGPVGNLNSIAVVGLVPNIMSNLMIGKAASKRFSGRDINNFCNAISLGLSQVLVGMVLSGTAIGIALGGGTGSFTVLDERVLSSLLYGEMLRRNINGTRTTSLCEIISFGIVNHLKTSVKFTIVVTGAVAPTPPIGPIPVAGIPSVYTQVS